MTPNIMTGEFIPQIEGWLSSIHFKGGKKTWGGFCPLWAPPPERVQDFQLVTGILWGYLPYSILEEG